MEKKLSFGALLPFIAYFNICFFWGTSTVANKLGSTALSPLMVGVVRFTVASVLIFCYLKLRKIPIRLSIKDARILGMGSFLMYFLNTMLLLFASVRVDAGISTITLCLIPVGMVLVDSIAMRRLCVSRVGVAGIIGGFVGISIVSAEGLATGGSDPLGVLLLIVSVAIWCVGTIFLKRRSVDAPFVMQIFAQSVLPAVAFFLCALVTGQFRPSTLSWSGFLPAAYMGVADSIIGLTSYIFLLRIWKTSVVSTYAYVNPIVGLTLSALILHETITPLKLAGMAVILLSVLIIQKEDTIQKRLLSFAVSRKNRIR